MARSIFFASIEITGTLKNRPIALEELWFVDLAGVEDLGGPGTAIQILGERVASSREATPPSSRRLTSD